MADLERLVNIDCGSYTKAGVDEVGRWVATRLRELGAEVTVQPNEELGDIVVGDCRCGREAGSPRRTHGHRVRRRHGRREAVCHPRGRANGPGVDDMKGGLLCGLYALQALRGIGNDDWLPFSGLTFVANPDEELGSPTSTDDNSHLRRNGRYRVRARGGPRERRHRQRAKGDRRFRDPRSTVAPHMLVWNRNVAAVRSSRLRTRSRH